MAATLARASGELYSSDFASEDSSLKSSLAASLDKNIPRTKSLLPAGGWLTPSTPPPYNNHDEPSQPPLKVPHPSRVEG